MSAPSTLARRLEALTVWLTDQSRRAGSPRNRGAFLAAAAEAREIRELLLYPRVERT